MGAELRAIHARMHRQGNHTLRPLRRPNLDRPIPATRQELVLGDEVPLHGKDLASVLLPGRDGEAVHADVEELDAAVAARGQELVLVRLAPRRVEEAVLRFEILFYLDPGGGQVEDEEAPVADEAEVCACRDAEAVVEEGGVFYGVGVEALGAEFEHGVCGLDGVRGGETVVLWVHVHCRRASCLVSLSLEKEFLKLISTDKWCEVGDWRWCAEVQYASIFE